MEHQHDQADHQQHVDEAAADMHDERAEQPQDDEDDGNGREHGPFLSH